MTSIHTYDPASGTVPPELPPMSMACMAQGVHELMDQAADLPQPCLIDIHTTQNVGIQLDPEAGVRAIAQWALRFGGVIVAMPIKHDNKPAMYHRAEFDYYGLAVKAYTIIPATPAT
jgi:hypothetical protein